MLVLALFYGYMNGLNGSASIIATITSSRALGIRSALALATLGIMVGPFVLGVAVARTIGAEVIDSGSVTTAVVMSGLSSALLWSLFTLWLKIPSSISHALIGGLIGGVWMQTGLQAILVPGLLKVFAGLFLSPLLGMVAGFIVVRLTYSLAIAAPPSINVLFKRVQIVLGFLLAVAYGANNGQNIMGVVVLGLLASGLMTEFSVPDWVVIVSAGSIGAGTLLGGLRLVRTLGGKFYKIRPIHGFGVQLASSVVIFVSALVGAPVSGSHVVTSAIVGAGSADRIQKIRWGLVRNILIGWVLTIPASSILSAILFRIIERLII